MTRPTTTQTAHLLPVAVVAVLLTGCTLASPRGATIAPARQTDAVAAGAVDCPPVAVAGHAPGLDPAQQANAKVIVGVALTRGLCPAGAAIGVAAALAESSLYNYANDGTSAAPR